MFVTVMVADDYYVAGVIIALSLLNEGPAPRFLSPILFEALIAGRDSVEISVNDLPDSPFKEDLQAVC